MLSGRWTYRSFRSDPGRATAFVPAFTAAAALAASSGTAAPAGAVEICTGHGPAWIVLPIARGEPLPPGGRKESGGCAHLVCPRESGGAKDKAARRA